MITNTGKQIKKRPHLLIAGGFVRDSILDKPSKDIDFATNLTYKQVEKIIIDHYLADKIQADKSGMAEKIEKTIEFSTVKRELKNKIEKAIRPKIEDDITEERNYLN